MLIELSLCVFIIHMLKCSLVNKLFFMIVTIVGFVQYCFRVFGLVAVFYLFLLCLEFY